MRAIGFDELEELVGLCDSCEQPRVLHRGTVEHCPNPRKGSSQNPLCKYPILQNGQLSFKLTYPQFPFGTEGNAEFLNWLARKSGIARSESNPDGYLVTADALVRTYGVRA